ncbi:MAG: helix-turn-helix domain-containing protein [Candidatus Omnitrophota bacterium]
MKLGKKLSKLRGNMTQAELSKRSKVDKAIISKIESGKMTGTVQSHEKIASVFGMKLSEFYTYLEEDSFEPAELHSGTAKTDYYQDFLEILTSLPLSKRMLPTFISLKPKEQKFLEETIRKSERFIYLIEGSLEIEVEKRKYQLKKEAKSKHGDSLYSLSPKRHKIKNTGSTETKVLCISSPPVL